MTIKRITYDTEFLENGKTIDLISIGMVNMDDPTDTFYAVSMEFDTAAVFADRWLMTNVMSSIDHFLVHADQVAVPVDLVVTDEALMTRKEIKEGILEYVDGCVPEWWAWHGAYDHVALSQIFGRMIDLPYRWPFFTNDIKQEAVRLGNPILPPQPDGLHNALDDARHNVVRYNYLKQLEAEREGTILQGTTER